MRLSHLLGIYISGIVWFIIGCFLTFKGLVLLQGAIFSENKEPLVKLSLLIFSEKEKGGLFLIFSALIIGLMKGRLVLAKTVSKSIKRLVLIPSPLRLKDLFPLRYLLLIFSMMMLGMILRFSPLSKDIRGFVDLAVGSALINGAFLYFKQGLLLKSEFLRRKK